MSERENDQPSKTELFKADGDIKQSIRTIKDFVLQTGNAVNFTVSTEPFICFADHNFGARFDIVQSYFDGLENEHQKRQYTSNLDIIIELSKDNTQYKDWNEVQDRMTPPTS